MKYYKCQEFMLSIPSSKTADLNKYMDHLKYIYKGRKVILDFYERDKVTKLKFSGYMDKKRATEELCDKLINKYKEPDKELELVVAFGNATFNCSLKNSLPGPCRKLRRELSKRVTVIPISEPYTSQKCHKCLGQLKPLIERVIYKDKRGKERETDRALHGVRVCPNCLITCNRDINAADNMLYIMIYMHQNRNKRPYEFTWEANKPAATFKDIEIGLGDNVPKAVRFNKVCDSPLCLSI